MPAPTHQAAAGDRSPPTHLWPHEGWDSCCHSQITSRPRPMYQPSTERLIITGLACPNPMIYWEATQQTYVKGIVHILNIKSNHGILMSSKLSTKTQVILIRDTDHRPRNVWKTLIHSHTITTEKEMKCVAFIVCPSRSTFHYTFSDNFISSPLLNTPPETFNHIHQVRQLF